jgi:ribosomal protein S18 acetylase RimI-like enzyme
VSDTQPDSESSPDVEAPRASERLQRRRLSELFWNLDWARYFPVALTEDGIAAVLSSYDAAMPFIRDHYKSLFDENSSSPFSTTRLTEQKAQYYRLAGDFFEIKHGERTVGLVLGTPVDWSTYYIRSTAVLREFQQRQLASDVLRFLFLRLVEVGVERVDADTSPANLRVIQILTSMGFNVAGTTLSDRWGAQVRLTRFLEARAEDVFARQFCLSRSSAARPGPARG